MQRFSLKRIALKYNSVKYPPLKNKAPSILLTTVLLVSSIGCSEKQETTSPSQPAASVAAARVPSA